jgi:hypothetical protein
MHLTPIDDYVITTMLMDITATIKEQAMRKILTALAFLVFAAAVGLFVVLAFWDIPVAQKEIETPLDASKLRDG